MKLSEVLKKHTVKELKEIARPQACKDTVK